MKHHRTQAPSRNLTRELLKEYGKRSSPVTEAEPKEIKPDASKQLAANKNVVRLNPKEYKKYKIADRILAEVISSSSRMIFNNQRNEEEFKKYQIEGVKLAIRSTDLTATLRAWGDVFNAVLNLPGRKIKGIPIRFQPMVDYMHEHYKCGFMVVDMDSLSDHDEQGPKKIDETEAYEVEADNERKAE